MIIYDPGYWGITCIFQLHGSIFPKAMVFAIPLAAVSATMHYFLRTDDTTIDVLGLGDTAADVFGGFNFVLGFLIVFRAQQAYSRWWEGGTLLQQLRGEWFNSFSCLVAFCNADQDRHDEVTKFQQQLVRLYSLLYGCALTQVSHMEVNFFELVNLDGVAPESLKFLQTCPDKCEITLQWIQRLIVESEATEILKIAPPILSRVYNELGNGIVNLNNARKIKEFPIPFALAQMIMVMLIFHAICTPCVVAATVQTTWWAAIITFVVTSCYWSLLYIALELEMPFGDDPNDLPLREMATDMNTSLLQLLKPFASAVPSFTYVPGTPLGAWSVDLDGDLSSSAINARFSWNDDDPESGPRRTSIKRVLHVGLKRSKTHEMNALARRAAEGIAPRSSSRVSRLSRNSAVSNVSSATSLGNSQDDVSERMSVATPGRVGGVRVSLMLPGGAAQNPLMTGASSTTSLAWSTTRTSMVGEEAEVIPLPLPAGNPRPPDEPSPSERSGGSAPGPEEERYAPELTEVPASLQDGASERGGHVRTNDIENLIDASEEDFDQPNGLSFRLPTYTRAASSDTNPDDRIPVHHMLSSGSAESLDSQMTTMSEVQRDQTARENAMSNSSVEDFSEIIPGSPTQGSGADGDARNMNVS